MSWSLQSVTAKQSGSGAVAVTYPASLAVGDAVFLFCNRGFGTGITFTAADFTALVSRTTNNSNAILYRVIDGTEGSTESVTNSAGQNCSYFMARFTGGPSAANFASSIIGTAATGTGGSTGLHWPALTVSTGGALVLVAGVKQASITSFDTPSPWTGELVHSATSDGGQAFVVDYEIQTAAANITSGLWTLGGDSSASNQAIIAAILPAAGYVPLAPMALGGMNVQVCQ